MKPEFWLALPMLPIKNALQKCIAMRLIADENISWRLKKNSYLSGIFCLLNEIKTDFRLSDKMIWKFAKAN
ncbi:hypothetical protein GCM10007352_29860 [Mucilaginibacter phyllosphaerae]|nr:hypothetical protein GCM10007352_29860 [Mucilaginibacter phyllosphaerae]